MDSAPRRVKEAHALLKLMGLTVLLTGCGVVEQVAGSSPAPVSVPTTPLAVRTIELAQTDGYDTEWDNRRVDKVLELAKGQTALVLLDVWASHPNEGVVARIDANARDYVLPLLQAARASGIRVIHAPHGSPIHPLVAPIAGELVIQKYELAGILELLNIRNVIFAGYASNICIIRRENGMEALFDRGFNLVFVRDASLAMEVPEVGGFGAAHEWATAFIEINYGASTTVADVMTWAQAQ